MASNSDDAQVMERKDWLESYRASLDTFDEAIAPTGNPRPHWKRLVELFSHLSPPELSNRYESARRILREHGATYNIYRDQQGVDRPWPLDLIPLLIPSSEWLQISEGLAQRTRLMNLIFADLYGPQVLLKEGLIPPGLLHGNPAFLRPCHNIKPMGGNAILLHAVDLVRSKELQWWALGDRTQAPSGTGYALENRIVLSRVFHNEFRDHQVVRLASFFQTEREHLRSLAPPTRSQPTIDRKSVV